MGVRLLYVTAGSTEEARKIGATVVGERLAACANIIPGMKSLYSWEGEVKEDEEAVLILKTQESLVPAATRRIVELHGYDCPCVVALAVEGGNREFLDWVVSETGSGIQAEDDDEKERREHVHERVPDAGENQRQVQASGHIPSLPVRGPRWRRHGGTPGYQGQAGSYDACTGPGKIN